MELHATNKAYTLANKMRIIGTKEPVSIYRYRLESKDRGGGAAAPANKSMFLSADGESVRSGDGFLSFLFGPSRPPPPSFSFRV